MKFHLILIKITIKNTNLFAFLHSKQQITTNTNKNKHAEDMDQKAT